MRLIPVTKYNFLLLEEDFDGRALYLTVVSLGFVMNLKLDDV